MPRQFLLILRQLRRCPAVAEPGEWVAVRISNLKVLPPRRLKRLERVRRAAGPQRGDPAPEFLGLGPVRRRSLVPARALGVEDGPSEEGGAVLGKILDLLALHLHGFDVLVRHLLQDLRDVEVHLFHHQQQTSTPDPPVRADGLEEVGKLVRTDAEVCFGMGRVPISQVCPVTAVDGNVASRVGVEARRTHDRVDGVVLAVGGDDSRSDDVRDRSLDDVHFGRDEGLEVAGSWGDSLAGGREGREKQIEQVRSHLESTLHVLLVGLSRQFLGRSAQVRGRERVEHLELQILPVFEVRWRVFSPRFLLVLGVLEVPKHAFGPSLDFVVGERRGDPGRTPHVVVHVFDLGENAGHNLDATAARSNDGYIFALPSTSVLARVRRCLD